MLYSVKKIDLNETSHWDPYNVHCTVCTLYSSCGVCKMIVTLNTAKI